MAEHETKFIDADEFSGSGKNDSLTFKDIVLQHLKKIGTYMSVEFRGGYWEEREVFSGQISNVIRTYVPDTREVFSNSVDYLHDILYPYFDDIMKQKSEDANRRLKKAFEDNTIIKEKDREDTGDEKDKYSVGMTLQNRITYRTERVSINRILFRELSCFLHRARYLEGRNFEESVGG